MRINLRTPSAIPRYRRLTTDNFNLDVALLFLVLIYFLNL